MKKYKSRDEVPEKYKWDLTDFFKNEKEFQKEYKIIKKEIDNLKKYVGCTKDSNKLYEFLDKDINTLSRLENLYIYAYLINDQELGVSSSIERKASTEQLMANYNTNTSFFEPELLKLKSTEYNKLFKENKKLEDYKFLLDKIYRNKEHILTENEEVIITELTSAMNHFEDMSSTMLNRLNNYGTINIDGKEEVLTTTNYRIMMKNENRDFRKNTRIQFNKVIDQYSTASAQFLNSFVKGCAAVAKIRKYKSSFDEKLFNQNMPRKAYIALREVVEENVSVYQKYLDLLKKTKNFDKLYPYDLSLELTKDEKEYSIEEAQALCLEAIKPLGEEYYTHFKKVFDNRYIDYAEYKGKCSGGYSFAPLDKDSRILMSYNYDLDSISTIIHEGGHNVHHQLISKKNPLQNREVMSIVSEVASLTNECLLSSYLAKNGKTKNEKLAGINNIINVINSNLFGSVREAHMEEEFYNLVEKDGTITKDYMNELTLNSLKKYYGNKVELDEYSPLGWVRRSHYYMYFYLYSYAFCISVASSIAKEILDGNKDMLDKYIKFLSTGGDVWPIDAFKILGIDLTKKDVYLNAIKYYEDMIDLYKKIEKED